MIQFNLLPAVKQEYIKTRRLTRLVTLVSMFASAAALFVLLLMLITVDGVQKKSLRDLDKDITSNSKTLKSKPNINSILTVQNQLNTLTGLHDQKVVASQLFKYISEVTPTGITISQLNIDYVGYTLTITGNAPSIDGINQFIDTLKSTMYKTDAVDSTDKPAFTSVVLASFGKGNTGVTYSTTMSFDSVIFSSANIVTLEVPPGTTTNESQLFKAGD